MQSNATNSPDEPAAGPALLPERSETRPRRPRKSAGSASEVQPAEDGPAETERSDNQNGAYQLPSFRPPRKDEDFWLWLTQFTSENWQWLIAYLWRTAPIHNRKGNNGRNTYIRKYGTRFDQETIVDEEGSGGYRIDFVAIDPGTGIQKRICQHFFEVMRMDRPPKLPPGDWINEPGNEAWKWCAPLLATASDAASSTAARESKDRSQSSLPAENGLTTALVSSLNATQTRLLELSSPGTILGTLRESKALFGGGESGTSIALEILRDDLRETRAELAAVRTNTLAKPPESMKDRINEIRELFEAVKQISPKGNQAVPVDDGGSVWSGIVREAMPQLLTIADGVVSLMRQQPRPPQQQQQQQYPQQHQQPAAAQAQPTNEQTGGDNMPQLPAELEQKIAREAALLYQISPFMADHFTFTIGGTLETAGENFQSWLVDRHGYATFQRLRTLFPVTELADAIGAHPVLRTVMQPRQDLERFLTAVYKDYYEEPEGEQQQQEGAQQ